MNILTELTQLGTISYITIGAAFIIGFTVSRLLKKKEKKIGKETTEARNKLREIYKKYQKELHETVLKIDKMLEILGEQ